MVLRPNLDTPLALGLAPLLAAQTVWVMRNAMQLPEPEGPRHGSVGTGPARRLLVLGDSSAAGVGVERQEQALTPQLARNLAKQHSVHWRLCARNGATTADATHLLRPVEDDPFDIAYVIFGVNDSKNLRPERAWRRDVATLITRLRHRHHVRHIFFSGLPRVQDFPLLPHPLRTVLALRARRFDRALQQVVRGADCHHLPLSTRLERSGMAPDGFHPGAPIYALWAEVAAEQIAAHL